MRDRVIFPLDVKPPSFDEKLRAGKRLDDGLAGAMRLREDWEKPWHTRTHKTTRCEHDDPGY